MRHFSRLSSVIAKMTDSAIHSRAGAMLSNFPPVAFVLEQVVRRHIEQSYTPQLPNQKQLDYRGSDDLHSALNAIAIDVVETLDYEGAIVAPYDPDGSLPVQAWYSKISREAVLKWEEQLAALSPEQPLSLTDPEIARVYIDRNADALNLGVRASKAGQPIISDDLYDLFRPIAPESTRPFIKGIQNALKVTQVIAVPFFIKTSGEGQQNQELVGNLFALSSGAISKKDQQALQAFGRQAAAAILSERRRAYVEATLALIYGIQTGLRDQQQLLEHIVEGMVKDLDYLGAMVATYEADGALPIRAWNTQMPPSRILEWEQEIANITPNRPISLTNPAIARVYVDRPEYSENLSIVAYNSRDICTSEDLFDLFRPITPESTRPAIRAIQSALGVKQVVAIPFFKPSKIDGKDHREFVENLFVLSRSDHLDNVERQVLRVFGQQAAEGIRNAQLYRQIQDRREAAEIFGKMAFSASASIHDLKNKIGVVRGFLQIVPGLHDAQDISEPIFRNLNQMADILDTLHEPFQQVPDTMVSINACIKRAVRRVESSSDIAIQLDLSSDLPEIYAAQDMITEVFKVIIKNGIEAVVEKGDKGRIIVTSQLATPSLIEITIQDNGTGLRPGEESRIFEMGWSTKSSGLGFGLFWSKDYIEGVGGTIQVDSVQDESTTFIIHLPVNTKQDS